MVLAVITLSARRYCQNIYNKADLFGLTKIAGLDIDGRVKTGLDIAGLDIDGRLWTIDYNTLTQ